MLWLTGHTLDKAADFLQLRRAEMEYLDGEIAKYLGFRMPAPRRIAEWEQLWPLYRRAKAGWAADVIRRRQKAYKQRQALPYQIDNPLCLKTPSIYEGELNARNNDTAQSDLEPEFTYDPHFEETHPDETDGADAI